MGIKIVSISQDYEDESESEVAQSCLTLLNPVDCSLPVSSIHGILQARILEWIAVKYMSKSAWHIVSAI